MKNKEKLILRDVQGSYLLERIFEDIHEYEVYFEFSNQESVDRLTPNVLRFSFKLNGRKIEIFYPDDERVVEFIIPISESQNNPQGKRKLTKRYIDEFADFIPKIRLSLKNQIAANNKIIGPNEKIKRDLDEAIRKRRTLAASRAKKMIKKKGHEK